MRLGKHEKELLYEIDITPGDVLLGFLCSACSISRMYKVAKQTALNRQADKKRDYDLQQRRKRMIERLEKKGLIKISPQAHDLVVTLSCKAQEHIATQKLLQHTFNKKTWDGSWTLLMFDIPTQANDTRVRLSHILQKIGFIQVQLSVYAFPYEVPELETFLQNQKKYGEHCHLFRGSYQGDDSALRKKFGLN